jgi:hypothetical protein
LFVTKSLTVVSPREKGEVSLRAKVKSEAASMGSEEPSSTSAALTDALQSPKAFLVMSLHLAVGPSVAGVGATRNAQTASLVEQISSPLSTTQASKTFSPEESLVH